MGLEDMYLSAALFWILYFCSPTSGTLVSEFKYSTKPKISLAYSYFYFFVHTPLYLNYLYLRSKYGSYMAIEMFILINWNCIKLKFQFLSHPCFI